MRESVSRFKFVIHGLGVDLACEVPSLVAPITRALGDFAVTSLPSSLSTSQGVLRGYLQDEVLKHLSPTATRMGGTNHLLEIYEQDERFWMIDDHSGLCQLNLLKNQFRSWVLEGQRSASHAHQLIQQMVMWPISQLLRSRGLCMIPAAAVMRDGWSALILSAFSLEPELRALVKAGWRIIGQNWTAIREEQGQIMMHWLPGAMSRPLPPGAAMDDGLVDLTAEFCGSRCEQAACDAVLLIAPGRRPLADLRHIAPANTFSALRRDWPSVELRPSRRAGQLPARLARQAQIFDVQLSRQHSEILNIMETARYHRPLRPPQVSLFVKPTKVSEKSVA